MSTDEPIIKSLDPFPPLAFRRPLRRITIDELLDCVRTRRLVPIPNGDARDPGYEIREVTLQDVADEFAAREELAKRYKAEADAARTFLEQSIGMPMTARQRELINPWWDVYRQNFHYEREAAMERTPLFPGRKVVAFTRPPAPRSPPAAPASP